MTLTLPSFEQIKGGHSEKTLSVYSAEQFEYHAWTDSVHVNVKTNRLRIKHTVTSFSYNTVLNIMLLLYSNI